MTLFQVVAMVIGQLHGQERTMECEMILNALQAGVFFHTYTQLWVPSVSQAREDYEM